MKRETAFMAAAALLLAVCCDPPSLSIGSRPRTEALGSAHDTGKWPGRGDSTLRVSMLVCGVRVPDGYDWSKDTTMGGMPSTVFLYRDSTLVLELPTGPGSMVSPYPDTHHLLGGHLYTEYSDDSRTVLLRDGKPFLNYSGAEMLRGMLDTPEGFYTLGASRIGDDVCLRKNGEPVLSLKHCRLLSDFSESPTGALYKDCGKIYWACKYGGSCYLVEDGAMKLLDFENIVDFRMHEGALYYITKTANGVVVCGDNTKTREITTYCQLHFLRPSHDGPLIVFYHKSSNTSHAYSVQSWEQRYADGEILLFDSRDGIMRAVRKSYPDTPYEGFTRGCATFHDGVAYLAGSAPGKHPAVLKKGKVEAVYRVNGYLTGIEFIQTSE